MSIREERDATIALPALHTLVNRFAEHADAYRAGRYNETQLRRDFLDPFFKLLGWDVHNEHGYAEAYREVVHEDKLKIGGATKAPDYGFRIGGQRKFFVEAKKPSVDIKGDPHPAYQLRRYAWSAKLPLSILTDFEELAVYDCTVKPKETDKASTARVMYVGFDEYEENWEELASIFSKEAILKGSFDKYAASKKKKRGTAEVDKVFLEEIEQWRDLLARNIALRNAPSPTRSGNALNQRALNFAVQRTIDRIVFLRICEDRGIEDYGTLRRLMNGEHVYRRLFERFRRADERYNSGLFHFSEEKGRQDSPDTLTPDLAIDDKVLKTILGRLYYPESPYEFSVLPADVLGQVYEQFLGRVIRLTPGHRAKVEEKPEVRKAGGVYYTPTYIVDYIVEHTVGKLLEGKTPQAAAGLTDGWNESKTREPIRVLDPACGSGSFLLGAYQFLLDWYRDRYVESGPENHTTGETPRLIQFGEKDWRLTTAERKRILLAHIYGVDIDRQAVEVTKLSLLLKVLEGESEQSLQQQLRLFQERALPDLAENIKCGNSLIGSDFYDNQQASLLDDEELYRVNAFDWEAEFSEVFNEGGFDAVIGNPPYVRIQHMKEWAPLEVEFYKKAYRSARKWNYDIYVVFVEKGLELLNEEGLLGYICPHKFFNARYGEELRGVISEGDHLEKIVHFGDEQVFDEATTYTCLLFLSRTENGMFDFERVENLDAWRLQEEGGKANGQQASEIGALPSEDALADEWNFLVGPGRELFEKLREMPVTLGDVAEHMAQGIRTSANNVYVLDLVEERGDRIIAHSKELDKNVELERAAVSLFLQGKEIKSYQILPSGKIVIIPYEYVDGTARLIDVKRYREIFPRTFSYLEMNRKVLSMREKGRMEGAGWYGYVYPKNIDLMALSKILVPDIADRAAFGWDGEGQYAFTSGYGITIRDDVSESPLYVLGLLNSNVLDFYLKKVSTTLRGGYFRYFTQYISQLPIRRINVESTEDASRHAQMVELVETMLDLNKRLAEAQTAHDKTLLERRIAATDRQIDRLVYALYGLTEEEVGIVEGRG